MRERRLRKKNRTPLLKVPPFKQTDDSRCGPAVVKMILAYNGIKATEDELCKLCNHSYEMGCSNEGMKKALESYGMKVKTKEDASLEDIKKYLDQKIPVMVDWFSNGVSKNTSAVPGGHASVVVGMDENNIYLLDPENAQVRKLLQKDFMSVWFDWKRSNTIQKWKNMVLRQLMIAENDKDEKTKEAETSRTKDKA